MSRWTEKGLTPEKRAQAVFDQPAFVAESDIAEAIRAACDEARAEEREAMRVCVVGHINDLVSRTEIVGGVATKESTYAAKLLRHVRDYVWNYRARANGGGE